MTDFPVESSSDAAVWADEVAATHVYRDEPWSSSERSALLTESAPPGTPLLPARDEPGMRVACPPPGKPLAEETAGPALGFGPVSAFATVLSV